MKILQYNKSRELLIKLFRKLGRKDLKPIDKFLKKRPINFGIAIWVRHNIPTLWYPQRKTDKSIPEVFEDVVTFDHSTGSFYELFLPQISQFLNQEKIKSIYTVGDWHMPDESSTRVYNLNPNELADVVKRAFSEIYFFPDDILWIFVVTHENFSFLAGSKEFIKNFKKLFPDWNNYTFKMDMLNKN